MPITISNPVMEKKLSDIAKLTNTDIEAVAENLLAESVGAKLSRLAAIQEGIDDFEAGRVVDHQEVMREVLASLDE